MTRTYGAKGFILLALFIFMVGCGTLQFKMQVENKLVIAKESGYQLMFRALKEIPDGETKERLKVSAETEFTIIYKDFDHASAVAVISTQAPAGKDFTSTVVRPGGLVLKYSA